MTSETVALLTSWNLEFELLVGFAVVIGLYVVGWVRLRRRSKGRLARGWRAWCFGLGVFSMVLALMSPIETFSDLFFFVHMTQHLFVVLVAPPLIWLGAPLLPFLWGLPTRVRRPVTLLFSPGKPLQRLLNFVTRPLIALVLFPAVLAVWHLPPYYDLAQGRTFIHEFEHGMFFATSLLFWWPVIHPFGGRRRLSYEAAIAYMIPPILESNLIGALLTFAPHPLYARYQSVPRLWGISVMLDQELGGLIMWIPGMVPYAIPIFILVGQLMKREEKGADEELVDNG